jgi:hypothetical protein
MTPCKSIALVSCYIGKLPWYCNYFLHSCRYNPSINFFIITDDHTSLKALSPNVKIFQKSLSELSELATRKLGFQVDIPYGYKLCDFKPAYAMIFSDLINDYDYWEHCDIDIIFGDIREFITDTLLEDHDLISVRPDLLTGCFLLYKNTDMINALFKHSKDYQKVFASDKHYCFDETNFTHDAFSEGKHYKEIVSEIESTMHLVKKMEAENYLKPYFDLHIIEGLPGRLKWKDGKMFYRDKYEILLYHMIYFKNRYKPKTELISVPNSFTISPTKIYHHKKLKV